jgi:hypothetical protein
MPRIIEKQPEGQIENDRAKSQNSTRSLTRKFPNVRYWADTCWRLAGRLYAQPVQGITKRMKRYRSNGHSLIVREQDKLDQISTIKSAPLSQLQPGNWDPLQMTHIPSVSPSNTGDRYTPQIARDCLDKNSNRTLTMIYPISECNWCVKSSHRRWKEKQRVSIITPTPENKNINTIEHLDHQRKNDSNNPVDDFCTTKRTTKSNSILAQTWWQQNSASKRDEKIMLSLTEKPSQKSIAKTEKWDRSHRNGSAREIQIAVNDSIDISNMNDKRSSTFETYFIVFPRPLFPEPRLNHWTNPSSLKKCNLNDWTTACSWYQWVGGHAQPCDEWTEKAMRRRKGDSSIWLRVRQMWDMMRKNVHCLWPAHDNQLLGRNALWWSRSRQHRERNDLPIHFWENCSKSYQSATLIQRFRSLNLTSIRSRSQ